MNELITALMRYLPLWGLNHIAKLGGHFRVAANNERFWRLPDDKQKEVLDDLYKEGKLSAHRAVSKHGLERTLADLVKLASQPQSCGVTAQLAGARDYIAERIKEKA
jgi:hypothetical protein